MTRIRLKKKCNYVFFNIAKFYNSQFISRVKSLKVMCDLPLLIYKLLKINIIEEFMKLYKII